MYEKHVAGTSASAVVVSRDYAAASRPDGTALIVVDDPYGAFARAMTLFAPEGDVVAKGVHPSAVVAESAVIGEGVSIGANVVVMEDAVIGDGTDDPRRLVRGQVGLSGERHDRIPQRDDTQRVRAR